MKFLLVDDGYSYDYLAILRVKFLKGIADETEFNKQSALLKMQSGAELHEEILASPEFAECVRVNTITYEGVDDAWQDKVKSSYVCHRNDDRYVAKVRLQKRFFPNSVVTEKKSFTKSLLV